MAKEKIDPVYNAPVTSKEKKRLRAIKPQEQVVPKIEFGITSVLNMFEGVKFKPIRARKNESASDRAARLELNEARAGIAKALEDLRNFNSTPRLDTDNLEAREPEKKQEVREIVADCKRLFHQITEVIRENEATSQMARELRVMEGTLNEFDTLQRLSRELNPTAADAALASMNALIPQYEKILSQFVSKSASLHDVNDRDVLEQGIVRNYGLLRNINDPDSELEVKSEKKISDHNEFMSWAKKVGLTKKDPDNLSGSSDDNSFEM